MAPGIKQQQQAEELAFYAFRVLLSQVLLGREGRESSYGWASYHTPNSEQDLLLTSKNATVIEQEVR